MKSQALLSRHRAGCAAVAAALGVAAAPDAHAQTVPACSSLSHPVYVSGSSAVKPFLKLVAAQLAGLSTPITVVYQGAGSCTGVSALSTTPSATISGTGVTWDTAGTELTGGCTLDTTGNEVDIGVSDVYASTCQSAALPADVHDFYGPVQAMTLAVPAQSANTSISAEAAYLVYGLGSAGSVPNWSDETLIFKRKPTSGTMNMIATAIRVPAAQWRGTVADPSGPMLTALTTAASNGNADKAIGILSADFLDANRSSVKALAYQHYGQSCGYWADSTASAFDKANVRDGHYMIWGPLHLLAHTTSGTVTNVDAKQVIDLLTGAVDPSFDLIQAEAKGGVVPDCAMRVRRDAEIGPLQSYMPAKSCECKFIFEATGSAPASCKACPNGNADCADTAAPVCNYGFCEVQ